MTELKIYLYSIILLKQYADKKFAQISQLYAESAVKDKESTRLCRKELNTIQSFRTCMIKYISIFNGILNLKPLKYYSPHTGVSIPVYELDGFRFLGEAQLDYEGPTEKINPDEITSFLSESDCERLFSICSDYFLNNDINNEMFDLIYQAHIDM